MQGQATMNPSSRFDSIKSAEVANGYHSTGPMREEGPPDHLSLSGVINVTVTDARQLLEEINQLRERLSPLLAERNIPANGRPLAPVQCKAAHELMEAQALIANCRELVYHTIAQLDL